LPDTIHDVAIIGSGPAGYTAAIRAGQYGLKTALIEKDGFLGGTCLNVGCIPSKALLHAARVIADAEEMAAFGVEFGHPKTSLEKLRAWRDSVVGKLTKGLAALAKARKVTVVQGRAQFASPQTLEVETKEGRKVVSFDHCIIAAGSRRWIIFASALAAAQRRGLRSMSEERLREFVADYRSVAADLARLQTAAKRGGSDELFYLSRLVAGGHNLLYKGRPLTLRHAWRVITVDAPQEVRRSLPAVLLSAAMLLGPAVIAYTAVVRDPTVERIFIPARLLDRAEGVASHSSSRNRATPRCTRSRRRRFS